MSYLLILSTTRRAGKNPLSLKLAVLKIRQNC